MGVVWDLLEAQWEQMYMLLEKFKDRENHCNVPQSLSEDGMMLGKWLSAQQRAMKSGKLEESSQRRLEEIGVLWVNKSKQQ